MALRSLAFIATIGPFFLISAQSQDYYRDFCDERIDSVIEAKVRHDLHIDYYVGAFVAARMLGKPSISGNVFKDPSGSLASAYIFIAEALPDSDLNKPKGLVGIYRADSILWRSDPLTKNLSTLGGRVVTFGDLLHNGTTVILISQDELPGAATANYLWAFTWDGRTGNLVTQRDDHGESMLAVIGQCSLVDVDDDGIIELQGEWYTDEMFDKTARVTYSWNGRQFGKWGKTSKYFRPTKAK